LHATQTNMTGKLNEHPLAELLREIESERLSGSLRLEHERLKTAIYFDNGELIYATSNLRQHRLAQALHRWRVITDAQLGSLAQANRTDAEIGRVLIEQGVLNEEALKELRLRQVADVLRPALLWTEGAWNFDPRVRLTEDVRVRLELPELLMEAARRLPKALTAARFPNTNERVQPQPEAVNSLGLLPEEAFVLSRIDMPLRLHELLSISGLPKEETLHACYALALGGLLQRESWLRAFSPEEVAKALAANAAVAERATTAAKSAPVPEAKPREEEAPKQAEPEVNERAELEELFERVGQAANHYQILGVVRTADQDTLKRTYHRLARRFHPDRFHQDAELHGRVEDVFAKIAQAYEVLRDKGTRAAYDLKIAREMSTARPSTQGYTKAQTFPPKGSSVQAPSTSPPTPSGQSRAEESFQSGLMAVKMGDAAKALSFFAEAARLELKTARYRAQYGQALAQNAQLRHRAEMEFQAAILIEPANIKYRILLAKLYRDLGLNKRAQGEIERALALDARNAEALRLLADLKAEVTR
jgi:curved DNA-binding protein CbpA